jgi:hypothetical protein
MIKMIKIASTEKKRNRFTLTRTRSALPTATMQEIACMCIENLIHKGVKRTRSKDHVLTCDENLSL